MSARALDPFKRSGKGGTVELSMVEALLIIRRRRGLTADQAAKRWGISARSLRSWEQTGNGRRDPSPEAEEKLRKIIAKEEAEGFDE